MKLNVKQIASITKPGRHSDGRNLYLNVTATGAKSWLFMWKTGGGKRVEMGLGSATGAGAAFSLTLTQARLKADAARAMLAAGINPLEAKIAAKVSTLTFCQLMEMKIATLKADWKVSADGTCLNEIEWRSSLTKHAAALLPMQAGKIGTAEVYAVLKPIWPTIRVTAERVRYRIEQVLELAAAKGQRNGMDNAAAYKGYLAEHLGKKRSAAQAHHAALAYAKVPAFMQRLLTHKGHAAKALAFLTLTAVRTDEARLMKRSEVDFATGLWTIPAERMKAGVKHIVPLSTAALELLASMPELIGNDFMFPGAKAGAALGPTALSDKLEELGLKGEATVHGMRSAFRDWCGDKLRGYANGDFEACLAHGLDATEGAYRRESAVEKRGEIMQAWANYCAGRDNVVRLAA